MDSTFVAPPPGFGGRGRASALGMTSECHIYLRNEIYFSEVYQNVNYIGSHEK